MEPSRPQPRLDRWTIGEALAYVIWRMAIAAVICGAAILAMLSGQLKIGHWETLAVFVGCFLWLAAAVAKALKRSL